MGSLDSLKRRGLMVCVGTASGPIPAFDPVMLAMKGSLFMTRPALADYIDRVRKHVSPRPRSGLRLIWIESSSFKQEVTDGITDDKNRRENNQDRVGWNDQ